MDIKKKKCFIFDLDGTVYMGDTPIQGTIDFIRKNIHNRSIFFMTNNTSKTPDEYVNKLKKYDINIKIDQIISPFIPLFNYLKNNHIKNIFLVANKKVTDYIKTELSDISLTNNIDKCQGIVLTFDTELTYDKLKTVSFLLQNNQQIKYVATHPDNVCPTNKGNIPDVGSFIKLIETTTGRVPEKIFGKPNIEILSPVIKKFPKEEMVLVGDRLYTDKHLADMADIDFILVLSGETTVEQAQSLDEKPALMVNDLGIFNN